MRNYGVLTVRNQAQKILFDEELSGQISDGMWENSRPYDHWEPWCGAEVVVGLNVGRNFYAKKDNYNFTNKDLLDVVGDRMVEAVRKGFDPDYTWDNMIADLKDLKQIIKIQRAETDFEQEARRHKIRMDELAAKEAQQRRNDAAQAVKDLAEELGVDVGYIGTSYVSYKNGLSYDKVLALVDAVRIDEALRAANL